jgi:hypothetical protein
MRTLCDQYASRYYTKGGPACRQRTLSNFPPTANRRSLRFGSAHLLVTYLQDTNSKFAYNISWLVETTYFLHKNVKKEHVVNSFKHNLWGCKKCAKSLKSFLRTLRPPLATKNTAFPITQNLNLLKVRRCLFVTTAQACYWRDLSF